MCVVWCLPVAWGSGVVSREVPRDPRAPQRSLGRTRPLLPEILRRLVRYIQHETDESVEEGITHAVFLVLANIGYFLSITWKFHQSSRNGVCIRGLVTLLLYEKSLRLNLNVDANDGIGTATNLMSNDTEQLFLSNLFTHYIWLSPMFVLIVFIWIGIGSGKCSKSSCDSKQGSASLQ